MSEPSTTTKGTGAALERAEQAELSLFNAWLKEQAAYKEYLDAAGSEPALLSVLKKNEKLAFDMYKGARDGLLTYDNKVDQSKKLAGQQIQQSEVARILTMFVRHWRIGIEQGITSSAQAIIHSKNEVDACEAIMDIMRDSLAQAIQTGTRDTTGEGLLPGWVIAAVEEGM